MKLETILDSYNANTIKEMLLELGKKPKIAKGDNVPWLAAEFARPERVQRELSRLNEPEKVVLAHLQQKHGQMNHTRLRQLMTLHADMLQLSRPSNHVIFVDGERQPAYIANPRYKGKPTFEDLLAGLAIKGLVLSQRPLDDSRTTLDWLHGRTIILPEYIQPHLDSITLPELPNPAAIEPGHSVRGSSQHFLRDLGRYGRYLRRKGKLPLTTQNQLYKDDLKAIAAEMSFATDLGSGKKETDNGRLYFLRGLLPKVELAQQRYASEGLTAVPDSRFWQMDMADRAQLAFRAWQDEGAWYELPNLHYFQRGNRTDFAPQGLVDVRKTILRHITQMGTGWISASELIETIKSEDYGFFIKERKVSRWSYYGSYTSLPYEGSNNPYGVTFGNFKDEKEGWNKVEADLINHVIAGPLHWMGLVDLGYMQKPPVDLSGNQKVDGYRLTPMGEWLLELGPKPEFATGEGNVVVQPNFEVVVMAPFDDEILLALDHFARAIKEGDHVITYEINRASVYNGQKNQWPVARVITWLETISKQPLPQNVRRSLEEWEALHQRITIRQHVSLLETAVPDVADQLESVLAHAARRVAPTVFLSKQKGDHLAGTLRAAGWPPLRTLAGVTAAPNSVIIDRDGRVVYNHQTPSIYAQGIITPLSVDTGRGRELTPTQVKANVSGNDGLKKLLASLATIHSGPLPDALVVKLKAWSHYYGNAHQETLTLIEFKDIAARDELLLDSELSQYLAPFNAPNRALAIVPSQHEATVHALLAERGVKIEEGIKK
ncbi:MAG TPA: helicase-associated domain-containing protein [Chloroflexota bacterium]|nr:helicase-associated domain-containing protein [Chloroflexota bacterium]